MNDPARRLGISDNPVRLRIKRETLPDQKIGEWWFLVVGNRSSTSRATTSQTVDDQQLVVMLEKAIERTGSKYVADITTLYERVMGNYREIIGAKDHVIAAIERERDELRTRLEALESARSGQDDQNGPRSRRK